VPCIEVVFLDGATPAGVEDLIPAFFFIAGSSSVAGFTGSAGAFAAGFSVFITLGADVVSFTGLKVTCDKICLAWNPLLALIR
jgi:hypothetical protein